MKLTDLTGLIIIGSVLLVSGCASTDTTNTTAAAPSLSTYQKSQSTNRAGNTAAKMISPVVN